MASNDRKFRNKTFLDSFKVALVGIIIVAKAEKNFRFHLISAITVVIFGFVFSISMYEWLFVCTAIFGMLTLELFNSAIERLVDLVTEQYHPLAKATKDIASGAVFLFAIYSLIVGMVVFLPKIWSVFILSS